MSSSAPWAMPERDAGHHQREDGRRWQVHDQRVDAGLAAHRVVGALGGDDGAVDVEVVAAGAAQPGHRPGVLDGDVAGGEHGAAQLRHAVDDAFHAVAEDHVGVLAPAGEAPATVDPVPTVDRRDGGGRVEHAGGDGVGVGGVERVEGLPGKVGEVDPGPGTDHHGPGDRRVGPGQRLERAHRVGDRGLEPAVRRRAHEPEAAGGPQLVEQVGRHSAARFDLARSVEDRRRQLADGVEHRLDGHRVVGDRHRRLRLRVAASGLRRRGERGARRPIRRCSSRSPRRSGRRARRSATACGRPRCARRARSPRAPGGSRRRWGRRAGSGT